jgi:signal transduction histidine kinase
MIWGMMMPYINDQKAYERTRYNQLISIEKNLSRAYMSEKKSTAALKKAIDKSQLQDVSIFVRTVSDSPVDGMSDNSYLTNAEIQLYNAMMKKLNEKLGKPDSGGIARLNSNELSEKINTLTPRYVQAVGVASYINPKKKKHADDDIIVYAITPLYPRESFAYFLKTQFIVISIFALLFVLAVVVLLTHTITRPIRQLTIATEQMGKGHFNVKFKKGYYTEIDNLAGMLTIAEHEMDKIEQYQKDLIANVSHDLKTPLSLIKSYAEMIRDLSGDYPEKRNEHLKVIIDETDRLNLLVNEMLTLTRLQSNRLPMTNKPFDFKAAADAVLASYNILQEQEGYKIEYYKSNGDIFVDADESRIKQVMTNFLTNAVKYCGTDKVIIVTVRRYPRKVRFSVEDHGMGIAPEELPHVWDKYYKSSTHHVRATEGTGIGLSIVREILRLQNAEFDVESTVGKGSIFWFELPTIRNPGNLSANDPAAEKRAWNSSDALSNTQTVAIK